ncbi:MAG: hypothetical protein ACJ8DY_17545, partial [Xanthobacteraceae bacterium]
MILSENRIQPGSSPGQAFSASCSSFHSNPRCEASGLQPGNRLGKIPRLEWREVIHALADANE